MSLRTGVTCDGMVVTLPAREAALDTKSLRIISRAAPRVNEERRPPRTWFFTRGSPAS